jgi:hypothetical protein
MKVANLKRMERPYDKVMEISRSDPKDQQQSARMMKNMAIPL